MNQAWNGRTSLAKTYSKISVLILCVTVALPQKQPLPPDLSSLVEAERAFAKASVERGVREAFLTYFADSYLFHGVRR
jgi:hypothetical protein